MPRTAPALLLIALAQSVALPPEQSEFFERKIRPILASECLECHGAEKQKGGLRLDYREGWKQGGDTGAAIVPGDPAKSLLIRSIRHEEPELEMPSKRPKLSDAAIADFEKWIAMGAPDPRDAPSKEAAAVSWDTLLADRKTWWSLQPVKKVEPPAVKGVEWSAHPVDRFLLAGMEAAGLAPGADADAGALCRRLTFIVTGLPPKPEEVEAFAREHAAEVAATGGATQSVERLVDRLLASPQFGERWARHWMDLARYAETHGSEGDPEIPHAWRYRDYLIRAFNEDVPWNQMIREHLAGDLLPRPRWNAVEGWNESILGTAHLRLVEHGFQPVDTRDEQVKVVESQIDVLGKAFQGMTFACARCHDHKFDAVSQRDYYALAGVFESSRPGLVTIDAPAILERHRGELQTLKARIKEALADAWLAETERISERMLGVKTRAAEIAAAQKGIADMERQMAELDAAARGRVLAPRGFAAKGSIATPMPIARWDFETPRAQLADLDARLEGDAELAGGRLKLRGRGHLQTAPLGRVLREKTLEAWVILANHEQQGGGVITVEDARGDVFDSIVFAEKDPRQWVAGSDFFKRSERLGGSPETAGELVHLALTYGADGLTALYRNGELYGKPWRAAGQGPVAFAPDARVLFGLRHASGKGNGYLRGEIEEARLYDRALTAAEVRASFAAGVELAAVTPAELAKAREPQETAAWEKLHRQLRTAREALAQLAPAGKDPWAAALDAARKDAASPLRPWIGETIATPPIPPHEPGPALKFRHGPGVATIARGDFSIAPEGKRVLASLLPAGTATGLLTRKHGGMASTRWFQITADYISVRAAGRDAQIRLMLDGYPLPNGQIFPRATLNHDDTRLVTMDVKYRKGARAYLEVATAEDLTRKEKSGAARSWFAVESIILHDGPAPAERAPRIAGFDAAAQEEARAGAFAEGVRAAIVAWRAGAMSEEQRALLDFLLRAELLPAGDELPRLAPLVAEFRRIEAEVSIPRRATGVVEGDHYDAAFLIRGDHHKPEGTVPRGYLGVLGGQAFSRENSGRLDLAEALVDPANPLTARVLVNRLWQSVFGRGLVATPDNFGKMGEKPTHPELLDFLAGRFVAEGWSAKAMLRFLLATRAAQLSSIPSAAALEKDPENRRLSRFSLRRLEAEAIRDSLLALSGKLDLAQFGPAVGGNAPRRSIYVGVRRTALNPFLQTFDAPKPFTTIGRRDSTNVPAQSLALMNDPFVIQCAERWAEAQKGDAAERAQRMFMAAFARLPTAAELRESEEFVASSRGEGAPADSAWRSFAHALLNSKEFLYLR